MFQLQQNELFQPYKAVALSLGHAKTSFIKQNETQEPLEPALILALTRIHPRIEVLACQKQAQSSH
jgi:hypothetical protein